LFGLHFHGRLTAKAQIRPPNPPRHLKIFAILAPEDKSVASLAMRPEKYEEGWQMMTPASPQQQVTQLLCDVLSGTLESLDLPESGATPGSASSDPRFAEFLRRVDLPP
jgi:hypothetical protein